MRVVATEILNTYISFEYDGETGNYYCRARPYNPETGTFISEEPLGIDGPNLYWYALNNPSNIVDPTGLDAILLHIRTSNNKPHSVLLVDNPKGGVVAIDYGPEGNYIFTGTVPEIVKIEEYPFQNIDSLSKKKYDVRSSSQRFFTSKNQDQKIIERARRAKGKNIPNNPLGLFGGRNCFGVSERICGSICEQ